MIERAVPGREKSVFVAACAGSVNVRPASNVNQARALLSGGLCIDPLEELS